MKPISDWYFHSLSKTVNVSNPEAKAGDGGASEKIRSTKSLNA
jgi:hypothetical protein